MDTSREVHKSKGSPWNANEERLHHGVPRDTCLNSGTVHVSIIFNILPTVAVENIAAR
jgi:hypothetical protein